MRVNVKNIEILKGDHKTFLVRDIKFSLEGNNVYAILGNNGEGKSVLLKSLTGLNDKKFFRVEAEVFLNDKNILANPIDRKEIAKKIGYVFQDPYASFDPLKKLRYYFDIAAADKTIFEDLLKYFLLPDFDKLRNKFIYELSVGMAQRFAISLALAREPSVIVLDEPTSSVDLPLANLISLKLREFVKEKNRAALLTTQDENFAYSCADHIARLEKGNLSEFQPSEIFFNFNK